MKSNRLNKIIKIGCIVLICILGSFLLTTFMTTGYIKSNLGLTLAAGNAVVGEVADKYDSRGAHHLVLEIDGYDALDYVCSESEYLLYDVGDRVVLQSRIVIAGGFNEEE